MYPVTHFIHDGISFFLLIGIFFVLYRLAQRAWEDCVQHVLIWSVYSAACQLHKHNQGSSNLLVVFTWSEDTLGNKSGYFQNVL